MRNSCHRTSIAFLDKSIKYDLRLYECSEDQEKVQPTTFLAQMQSSFYRVALLDLAIFRTASRRPVIFLTAEEQKPQPGAGEEKRKAAHSIKKCEKGQLIGPRPGLAPR